MCKIYCCECVADISARLITGDQIYKSAKYKSIFMWICDECGNYVGTHKDSKSHAPLGCIPTPELRSARGHIHALLDPMWKSVNRKRVKRRELYDLISRELGWSYHTAKIRTIEEARQVYGVILSIKKAQKINQQVSVMSCNECTDLSGEKIYQYYGVAPHNSGCLNSPIGQSRILAKEEWPENFREDRDVPGCGTYTHCLNCGE